MPPPPPYKMHPAVVIGLMVLFGVVLIVATVITISTTAKNNAKSVDGSVQAAPAEAPDRITRPLFERIVQGGVRCENFTAFYIDQQDRQERRSESGSCMAAPESVFFFAYRSAEDRDFEIAWLASTARQAGYAPMLVYGDLWAVSCDDPMTLNRI